MNDETVQMTTPSPLPASSPLQTHVRPRAVMLGWLKPGAEEALAQFRQGASSLFVKYDVRVERVLTGVGKGQLVGNNPHEVPQLLQVISFPSVAAFQAYTTDPDYVRLAKHRDAYFERMTVIFGIPLDVSELQPASHSTPSARLYGVALVRFHADGAAGLSAFNQRAGKLFARHGMHVELMCEVTKTVAPIGQPLSGFAPERVIVFYLDDPGALRAYATDPEYLELSPIRDRGLAAYDFFLAKVPA